MALKSSKIEVPTLPRSWWKKNPQVAEFVYGLLGTMRILDMPSVVAARFGPELAPSKSAIARYMSYLRGGPGFGQKRSRRRKRTREKPGNLT